MVQKSFILIARIQNTVPSILASLNVNSGQEIPKILFRAKSTAQNLGARNHPSLLCMRWNSRSLIIWGQKSEFILLSQILGKILCYFTGIATLLSSCMFLSSTLICSKFFSLAPLLHHFSWKLDPRMDQDDWAGQKQRKQYWVCDCSGITDISY